MTGKPTARAGAQSRPSSGATAETPVDPVDGQPAVAVIDGEPMSLARWTEWLGTHPTDPDPDAEQEK